MVLPVVATAAVRRAASSTLLRRRPTAAFPSTARAQTQQTRKMGGGQPESQSMKARLWEGHSPEPEGWEPTLYATYVVGFGLITLALGFSPDTSIASVSLVTGYYGGYGLGFLTSFFGCVHITT